jgi:hypothetical protein
MVGDYKSRLKRCNEQVENIFLNYDSLPVLIRYFTILYSPSEFCSIENMNPLAMVKEL